LGVAFKEDLLQGAGHAVCRGSETGEGNMPMCHETQRTSMQGAPRRRVRGFTLIELMVTVAIVAILAAIAYPSYLNHVVRANRSAAQGYMLELSNLEQRYLLDARTYLAAADNSALATANWPVPTTVQANYAMKVELTSTTPPGFKITATPTGNQFARDTTCGVMTITEAGTKTPTGSACW
jgi:type IV pilus assembly protein PilE